MTFTADGKSLELTRHILLELTRHILLDTLLGIAVGFILIDLPN